MRTIGFVPHRGMTRFDKSGQPFGAYIVEIRRSLVITRLPLAPRSDTMGMPGVIGGGRSSLGSLTSGQEKLLDAGRTPATDFAENARDALLFSLIQTPLSGATQLVDKMIQTPLSGATHLADKTVGTDLMAKTQIFSAPKQAEFGTSAWLGQVTGSTLGTALPFIALHRMMGPGAAAKLEITNNYGLCRAAMPALGKSMLVGGAYAAVLQPVNEKEEGNFWLARGRNAATGSLVGLTLTATAIGLKSTGVRALNHDIVAGGLSGIPAGLVSANSHSLLSGKGLATGKEIFKPLPPSAWVARFSVEPTWFTSMFDQQAASAAFARLKMSLAKRTKHARLISSNATP